MQNKAEALKQAIVDRIRSGAYPVGGRLPSLRAAAAEFGVHANTAAKVYGDLAEHGIIRMIQGAGTYVLAVPEEQYDGGVVEKLFESLRENATQARRLGLSRSEWARLSAQAESAAFEGEGSAIWFVECSPRDMTDMALSLSTLLDRPVRPLLVDDVPHHLVTASQDNDFFVTTPFHAEEVEDAVQGRFPVVNINVVPTSETLVRFARIEREAQVVVVASNRQTLERFVRMIRTYLRREPAAALLVDNEATEDAVRDADIVVDSQSIHERVQAWRPEGQIITIRYQIEPTSLAFLREVLNRGVVGRAG